MDLLHVCMLQFLLLSLCFAFETSTENICYDSICDYTFIIEQSRSMTYKDGNKHFNVELNQTDLYIAANDFHMDNPLVGTVVDSQDAITADGFTRNLFTINGQFPGPTIEVMKGSQIVVKVVNRIKTEPASIHWHGLYATGTPWMDGVPYVTECPILPYQSFTYKFMADPVGTHWYHSHFETQKSDGLFGMIIVHETIPVLSYVPLMVGDWFHRDAKSLLWSNPFMGGNGDTFNSIYNGNFQHDGFEANAHKYEGGLINGRGRSDDMEGLPLHIYTVPGEAIVEFRAVCTSAEYGYELSVDEHKLTVVSSDGHTIKPIMVDSIFIFPGERYDFRITTTQATGRYWLRAKVAIHGIGPGLDQNELPDEINAIIHYEGSSESGDPTSSPKQCSSSEPCKTLNCPFPIYSPDKNIECEHLSEIKSSGFPERFMNDKYGLNTDSDDIIEVHLNFGYPIGSSINARKFVPPRAPFFIKDHEQYIENCDDEECKNGCLCTNILDLPPNRTIQMVFSQFSQFVNPHSIHLHGHSFAVIAQEFYEPDNTTARMDQPNRDIQCNNDACSHPKWRNGPPEANLQNPVIKDTVIVAPYSYVVVRFKTDNPGYWMLHCHQDSHMLEGMAMVINEAPSLHPEVPMSFPTCGDWPTEIESTTSPKTTTTTKDVNNKNCDQNDSNDHKRILLVGDMLTMRLDVAIGTMFGLVLLGAVLSSCPIMVYLCRKGNQKDSA